MNAKRIVFLLLAAPLIVGTYLVYQHRPVSSPVQLKLTGTPGLKVGGTYVSDGVTNPFSGSLPAEIKTRARNFDYTIYMQEPTGSLRGEILVTGPKELTGSSAIENDFAGVSGSYAHTWSYRAVTMTTTRDNPNKERSLTK